MRIWGYLRHPRDTDTTDAVADAWKELIDEAIRDRRHSRVLKQLKTLTELIALVGRAEPQRSNQFELFRHEMANRSQEPSSPRHRV